MSRGLTKKSNAKRDAEGPVRTQERWAPLIAAVITLIHFVAGLVPMVWYYFFVPRAKHTFDNFGMELPQNVILIIKLSDLVVNYWYLGLILGPLMLAADYFLAYWLTRLLGLIASVAYTLCVAAMPLLIVVLGEYVLSSAMDRLLQQLT